jgi:hypothetical protein
MSSSTFRFAGAAKVQDNVAIENGKLVRPQGKSGACSIAANIAKGDHGLTIA